jgi:hypothetical protein
LKTDSPTARNGLDNAACLGSKTHNKPTSSREAIECFPRQNTKGKFVDSSYKDKEKLCSISKMR